MTAIIIFILIIAAVAFIAFSSRGARKTPTSNTPRPPKRDEVTTDPDPHTGILDRTAQDVYISGLSHHCTIADKGYFIGVVFNEKNNAYNSRAMAIADDEQKRIFGYISENRLELFREWCKGKTCPCIGYIFHDGEYLRGRIRAYLPTEDPEKVNQDAKKYASIVCEHFGWKLNEVDFE